MSESATSYIGTVVCNSKWIRPFYKILEVHKNTPKINLNPAHTLFYGYIHPGTSISPKQMMHITYSPYFQKIYKCSPYFKNFFNFPPIFFHVSCYLIIYVFCFPLFWPWCIYSSCFARTGRPIAHAFLEWADLENNCKVPKYVLGYINCLHTFYNFLVSVSKTIF